MDSKHNSRIKSLFIKSRMIYHKTPACFRCIFLPVKLILRFTRILRLDLWIIRGEEITSKEGLAIIYFGNEKNKNYLAKLAFDSSYREKYIGKRWVWRIFKAVRETDYGCSLMVVEIPKTFRILFENKKSFYIPCWISGEVDVSAGISAFIKNDSVKTDLRKIRKNKLYFELTSELSQLHNFYHNMYLPYITKVHGNRAFINEHDVFKKEFRNCDLLLIKKGKEYIAGTLIAYTKNKARVWCVGIKDGNMDYMKDGAVAALYYFSVHYLKEKGFKKVGFGLSRAFLKDGVLQFKKKRGIQIFDTCERDFLVKPLIKTVGVKGFFLNNPFIYKDKRRLNGAIFMETDQSLSEKDFGKIYKSYYLPGMSKLIIYRFGESDNRMQEVISSKFDGRMAVHSAESLF